MAKQLNYISDSRSGLIRTLDAVHGPIDIRDASSRFSGMILRVLNSQVMQRLRRIKQLGFAYQSYPAADHSRYAHALGTMQMMRAILERLEITQRFDDRLFKSLAKNFPTAFIGKKPSDHLSLLQHMLVAALIQDIGELPFSQSTKHVYRPSDELILFVENKTGLKVNNWSEKDVFTIACMYSDEMSLLLKNLSLPFITYLLTGEADSEKDFSGSLCELRQMIDGVVDADRLDYVFRDAYHTVGGLGSSRAVIESLLYYDSIGPVFSDPGPVSNFLATRAYLYSDVYYAPANRFGILLMVHLLKGIAKREECAKDFFGDGYNKGISIEDFLELDDVSLLSQITNLSFGRSKRRLDQQTRIALDILAGSNLEYRCFWLPPQTTVAQFAKEINLPSELFFDTFADQFRSLYKTGTIRIESSIFSQIKQPVPLEECGGPLSAMFKPGWSISPMPDSIMIYVPKDISGKRWELVQKGLRDGWLYEQLRLSDPFGPVDFPTDTRNNKGFIGRTVFISFAWPDIKHAKRIAKALFDRKRRFFLFAKTFQGLGKTPAQNSTLGVDESDAVIIITSVNYCSRYKEAPNGNIAKEIFAMSKKVNYDAKFKVIPLAFDDFHDLEDALPWSQLGFSEIPFVGISLNDVTEELFSSAIDELINTLDAD